MKDNENRLIWEQYNSPGRAEGGNIPFPDGRGEMADLDEEGREYIFKEPERYENDQQIIDMLKRLPFNMGTLFRHDREGSFLTISATDRFYQEAGRPIDGDGMGGIIEYDLGYAIVGLEDGNFLSYIKHAPSEKEDPDADHETLNDYKRREGL